LPSNVNLKNAEVVRGVKSRENSDAQDCSNQEANYFFAKMRRVWIVRQHIQNHCGNRIYQRGKNTFGRPMMAGKILKPRLNWRG